MLHAPGFRSSARFRVTDRSAKGTPLPLASRLRSATKETSWVNTTTCRLSASAASRAATRPRRIWSREVTGSSKMSADLDASRWASVKNAAKPSAVCSPSLNTRGSVTCCARPDELRLVKQRSPVRTGPGDGHSLEPKPVRLASERVADHLGDALLGEFEDLLRDSGRRGGTLGGSSASRSFNRAISLTMACRELLDLLKQFKLRPPAR